MSVRSRPWYAMTIAWNDAQLASRLPEGAEVYADERETFDAFVRARLPQLLRFGWMLTGTQEAGADLVQDALERTLIHWRRVDSRDDPEGYVRRIMVNRNISIWRKRRREYLTAGVRESGRVDRHHDHEIWLAVQQLPARQRAVIVLRYYEDLSEAEIARLLECSTGTVKSQASKALTRLRKSSEIAALHSPDAGPATGRTRLPDTGTNDKKRSAR
jgi:RNA polymerase sigma-70 factor (sigma-E family)